MHFGGWVKNIAIFFEPILASSAVQGALSFNAFVVTRPWVIKESNVCFFKIISQIVSSNGCERNSSTFSLIHSKQNNYLKQKRLSDLVYIHYYLILRLKCAQVEVELKYSDPIISDFVNKDEDSIIGRIVNQQQEPEFDEPELPLRPASFIASEAEIDAKQQTSSNISHKTPTDTSQYPSSQSRQPEHHVMRGQATTQSKDKKKRKNSCISDREGGELNLIRFRYQEDQC